MPLTNFTELQQFLTSLGLHPKKGLSQNFLIDGNIVRKIIKAADVQPGDAVLEIGPGPGALTEALVGAGAKVFAVERDYNFAQQITRFPGVEVFEGDILTFPLEKLSSGKPYKVVSNLPYHLTSPILGMLVPHYPLFSTITVMVQEEVARRMTALPKTGDYSSLTVFLNFYANTRYEFGVRHHCFYPKPKVDSAVVTLTLKNPPDVDSEQFFKFVRTSFQQRRKMVKKTLGDVYGKEEIIRNMKALGLPESARPEELSVEESLALFRSLSFFVKDD